jgi:hypothetical protein
MEVPELLARPEKMEVLALLVLLEPLVQPDLLDLLEPPDQVYNLVIKNRNSTFIELQKCLKM